MNIATLQHALNRLFPFSCFLFALPLAAAVKDAPFVQDSSIKFSAPAGLQGAEYQRLAVERDGIVYVLTDKGLARLFGSVLALDKSFRPLAGKRPLDITLQRGQLFYLYADQLLSNASAGKPLVHLPTNTYRSLVLTDNGAALVCGDNALALFQDGKLTPLDRPSGAGGARLYSGHNQFFLFSDRAIFRIDGTRLEKFHEGADITALAFRGEQMLVGTRNGYYGLSLQNGRETLPRQTRLPGTNITCFLPVKDGLWVGTTRGVFRKALDGQTSYYASKRWLSDDHVVDLQMDEGGDLLVLTKTGLNRIQFRPMTLVEKAAHYDRKIRQRHIRFGFCSELRLLVPGDITTAEMIDTDNDGTWSNYYMASQAFRFGATGSEEARRNSWETFEAMERLESINGLDGFPSRTFERIGFKFSDPDRWHPAPDADWEWKAHTSSDEIAAHTFGCAVLYETVAKTDAEKKRIATYFDKVMSHIVRNNYYLIDVDGQPTLWARWNPEYVNWYPHSIVDRRLNSAEIVASLQLAWKITGKELYRQKAFELMDKHGYLDNILSSMKLIAHTPGFIHRGDDMGNEWNHSDDLLSFVTYWVLHRYAFEDELKRKYASAIKDHFEIEKHERCPIWNFVYASTGAKDFDVEGALWTLRKFPLDMIDWHVENSHRQDLTRFPPNFRHQQVAELLPPGERRVTRWNGQPFTLDGGSGGQIELAGDEFLLPYWMGRYLRIIE